MNLDDLDSDLEFCKNFIKDLPFGSPIQDYLTKFMLIHVAAEYDKKIKQSFHNRIAQLKDDEVTAFVDDYFTTKRNIDYSTMKDFLSKFNKKRGKYFENSNATEIQTSFLNIIQNRHWSAHGQESKMTIRDLIHDHKNAKDMIKNFESSLFSSVE